MQAALGKSEVSRRASDSGQPGMEAGNTVLVVTHDPELVELCCDYVMRIEDGEVTEMQNAGNAIR